MKLLISTTLHEHGTETLPAYSDKYWEHPLFLSRRINFCSFFYKVLYFKKKWSVYERRRSTYLRMLCLFYGFLSFVGAKIRLFSQKAAGIYVFLRFMLYFYKLTAAEK